MALTISNLRLNPYTQKDSIKPVYGDTLSLTFTLPEAYQNGDEYILGLDFERVLIPTGREICALADTFTISGNDITFELEIRSARFRDWASKIKKPMPCWLQIQRKRNNIYETILLDDVLALPSLIDGQNTVYHGDPLADLLEDKLDKPEADGQAGNILKLGSDGETVWSEETETTWTEITSKPEFANVAYTGNYNDLSNKPTISAQVQADWNETNVNSKSYIKNRPNLAAVAITADYNDLNNVPAFAKVASTGKYDDLSNKPSIPVVNDATITFIQGNSTKGSISLNQSTNETISFDIGGGVSSVSWDDVSGKPNFATVASTGSYNDLSNKPTIPAAQVQANWNETNVNSKSYIKNRPNLATVATTGKYNDLTGKPSIPTVNNATISFIQGGVTKGTITLNQNTASTISFDAGGGGVSSVSWDDIESKPVFATVASTGKYEDLVSKPTIPTVNNATITFTQGGSTKGTISLNQSANSTIAFDMGVSSVSWDDVTSKPVFASVASTGDYNDLINKPSIPNVLDATDYLCFTNGKSGASTLYLIKDSNTTINLEYSTDKITWSNYTFSSNTGETITLSAKGDKVYFRGNNEKFGRSSGNYSKFVMTGTILASGNIMSLLDKLCEKDELPTYAFNGLFYGCTALKTAPKLPCLKINTYCYYQLFKNCTSLVYAPDLPSEMIATAAYSQIFQGCSNLIYVKIACPSIGSHTTNWLDGVASSGTFVAPSTLAFSNRGKSTVPTDWQLILIPAQMDEEILSASRNPVENSVLYTALESKADALTTVSNSASSITISNALPNTYYNYGELTSLAVESCAKSIYETIITFTNGANACSISLPENVNSAHVETPVANSEYILTIRYNIATGYNVSEVSSGGGGGDLTATGGSMDFTPLNGAWTQAGSTTVDSVTAPYYSRSEGGQTYYLTRANSLFEGANVWAITSYNIEGEADEWFPNLSEAAMAYVRSNDTSPVGLTFSATYNFEGNTPTFA